MKLLKCNEDINFEWVASYLITNLDLQLSQLEARSLGIFGRYVNHDIEQIKLIEGNRKNDQILKFELNREGVYDSLPHGMFHKPVVHSEYYDSSAEIKNRIKSEKQKENDARKFFFIFENELLRVNTFNKIIEEKCNKLDFGPIKDQVNRFIPIDLDAFSDDEATRLLLVLPLIKHINNKNILHTTKTILHFVLKEDIKLAFKTIQKSVDSLNSENSSNTLGEINLNWNFTLGASMECLSSIVKIDINKQFESEGNFFSKTEMLAEWLFPMYYEIDIRSNYKSNTKDNSFLLGYHYLNV